MDDLIKHFDNEIQDLEITCFAGTETIGSGSASVQSSSAYLKSSDLKWLTSLQDGEKSSALNQDVEIVFKGDHRLMQPHSVRLSMLIENLEVDSRRDQKSGDEAPPSIPPHEVSPRGVSDKDESALESPLGKLSDQDFAEAAVGSPFTAQPDEIVRYRISIQLVSVKDLEHAIYLAASYRYPVFKDSDSKRNQAVKRGKCFIECV